MRFASNKSIIILIIIAILACIQPAYAHGLIYETKMTGAKSMRVTLKWSDPGEAKGIAIAYYHLKNGKTLDIGYEIKDMAPTSAYLDYDLAGAILPIRITLSKTGDPGWAVFDDIKGIEAEEYIRHLHDAGIVNGRSGNSFKPGEPITRAEFMVLMVKALKLEGSAADAGGYTDIGKHWAKNILLLAARRGLISGYGDGTIRPDNPVTLAEASAVIARGFSFKTNRNGIYAKPKQNMWYSSSIKKMLDAGILTINDSIYVNFNEQSPINRANCAMMISRALSTY